MEKRRENIRRALKTYWGYDGFRPGQEEIILSVLDGEDVLGLMPTGGGKSICFQVPAMVKDGVAIVVSPLIALIRDQVSNLRKRGIRATGVYSGMTAEEIDAAIDNAVYGDYKFIYVSPERLATRIFRERLKKMNVSLLVVDEAHCISQWGYDFRPNYLKIAEIREMIPDVPVMAMTATATPQVASDIMEKLLFRRENLFVTDFARPNLSYVVRHTEDKIGNILKVVQSVPGTGIIYARTRKRTEELTRTLRSMGVSVDFYHAGLSPEARILRQKQWVEGHTRIIVATNAFGMGIDKPDVRFVIHYDLCDSLEAYFQEAGRAGRDGLRAYAVLLHSQYDIPALKKNQTLSFPEVDYIASIYQKVCRYLGIAYEEGSGITYRFDVKDFASELKLPAAKAYYAVKYIEMEGYWTLTDESESPSRVAFIVNRDELYGYQLGDEFTDRFVKAMMRIYTGLFSSLVKIDENHLSSVLKVSPVTVKSKLVELSRKHILKYIPKSKSPLITMHGERLTESNFLVDLKKYNFLKSAGEQRMNAMIDYVLDSSVCRSVKIAEYFGQKIENCGYCDVCLSAGGREQARESAVLKLLDEAEGRIHLSEIILQLENRYPGIVESVRDMAERNLVGLEKGDYVVKKR